MKRHALLSAFVVITHILPALAQWQKPQFTRLSTNEGLSQSHVNAILKDSKGFMWFGTDEGLNKYDGYKFSVYKHYAETSTSISNNFVQDIVEDRAGKIWLATRHGLEKFDRVKDTFSHYQPQLNIRDIYLDNKKQMWLGTTTGLYCLDSAGRVLLNIKSDSTDKNSLTDNAVNKITEDHWGNLWIATQHGLNKLSPGKKRIEQYLHDPGNPGSIGSNLVRTVVEDARHTIWAGMTGGGIARYDVQRNAFVTFSHSDTNPASIGHNDVLSIMDGSNGSIWIGTENGGISVYNTRTNRFLTFTNDSQDDKSLSNNSIYCLYKDDINNIWVGTYSGGVNFLPALGSKFKLYQTSLAANSLSNNIVLSIKGDSTGQVWLGTDGGGLNEFNQKTGQFTTYRHQLRNNNSLATDYIISLAGTTNHQLVLGYHRYGLGLLDIKSKRFMRYISTATNKNDLPINSIISLYIDRKNNIWIGTWLQGLYYYNITTKKVTHYVHNPDQLNTICDNSVNCAYEDKNGLVWFGTQNGLDCFNPATNRFVHFQHNPKNKKSISSNTINCLLGDGNTGLWLGTSSGLCRLRIKTGEFTVFSEKNGLPSNVVNGMIHDVKGDLWLSTNKGISRYNAVSNQIRNYTISDGLQGNEFKPRAAYQDPDRTLYFGGSNGLNVFHPDSIADNKFVPPVYLTDFQVFNKPVIIGASDSPLKEHINSASLITLTHHQGVFSFEFAALNYTLPQKNQYAYKLEGFDKEWNYVGNKRTATYTNLDPGDYTFRVKGANNDGIWNEKGVAVTIRVLPPYWETWWFRTLAILLVVGAIYLFYKGRIKTIQAQKWALERIVEERTERLHQEQVLNKMKSQFVSTASHEFRTPLATIQSSIDLVDIYLDFPADNGKSLIQKHLRIVEKEIGKFGDLLDDVLTIEKMNAGKVGFAPRPVDLLAICDDIIATHFQMRKDQRRVDVLVNGQPRPVLLDEKLIRHALVNLLSNAFKFSPTNPRLTIIFETDQLMLTVSDDGIGIPDHDVSHLFETFFRAGNVSTIQGTGLGLFIAKQSVESHGGTIAVQSQENAGTTFTIVLPA